jgi:D-glycero-alpha-D-manno-heptose-7-phosphate kinase
VQDQLCSAYGGINFIEVRYPEAHVMPVVLDPSTLLDLEARSLVVYTGKSHFSSGTHKSVIGHFESGDSNTIDAMDRLNETAEWGLKSLLEGDLEGYAEALNFNWKQQKRLHPSITTPQVENMHQAVLDAGAIGFKLNGAGAGGTAMILCKQDCVHLVKNRLQEEFPESEIFPMKLDLGQYQGMQVWETHTP